MMRSALPFMKPTSGRASCALRWVMSSAAGRAFSSPFESPHQRFDIGLVVAAVERVEASLKPHRPIVSRVSAVMSRTTSISSSAFSRSTWSPAARRCRASGDRSASYGARRSASGCCAPSAVVSCVSAVNRRRRPACAPGAASRAPHCRSVLVEQLGPRSAPDTTTSGWPLMSSQEDRACSGRSDQASGSARRRRR